MAVPTPQTVFNSAANTARQTAVAAAQKVAQENLKIIQEAQKQVGITPEVAQPQPETPPGPSYEQLKAESDQKSRQLLAQLEAEVAQIRQQNEQRAAQRVAEIQNPVQQVQTGNEMGGNNQKKKGGFAEGVKNVVSKLRRKRETTKQKG